MARSRGGLSLWHNIAGFNKIWDYFDPLQWWKMKKIKEEKYIYGALQVLGLSALGRSNREQGPSRRKIKNSFAVFIFSKKIV